MRFQSRQKLTSLLIPCYNFIGAARLPGRKEADGAWLLPSFLQKGVMIMTDYEILAIVLWRSPFTTEVTSKKAMPPSSVNCLAALLIQRGEA